MWVVDQKLNSLIDEPRCHVCATNSCVFYGTFGLLCLLLFKPGAHRPQCAPGFLKLFLCGRLYVCLCVCPPPRLLITSDVMWRDMDPIRLVKQVL